jgi:CheY-like chemotaxis protein
MKKILIADDSTAFRKLEEAFLAGRGYKLLHAEDGLETIRITREQMPDLILLDIQMPVMDGVQVLTQLKSSPETSEIPVVVISTIGRTYDRDLLLKAGADEFIAKPINGSELLRTVRALLGQ